MKSKLLFLVALFAFSLEAYPQFKVNANGSAQFRVGSDPAGFTGDPANSNVSFGFKTLNNPSAAQNYNSAFGTGALYSLTSGYGNTAVGGEALYSTQGGHYNTAVGAYTQFGSGNLNNSTAIGYEAGVTASNQVRIGSTSVSDIGGKMLKKLEAPAGDQTLVISGSELRAGTYLYTLVADGKKVDTKRMILTK